VKKESIQIPLEMCQRLGIDSWSFVDRDKGDDY